MENTLSDEFEAGLIEIKNEFLQFGLVLILDGFLGLSVDGVIVRDEIHFSIKKVIAFYLL